MSISKSRFVINSVANVGSHFLRLFIGIFMTPFLLNHLGTDVYGIMPLVNTSIAYVVLVTGGIQSSVGRYFTLYMARNEPEVANKYASTAFFLLIMIVAISSIPFLVFAFYFPYIFEIPVGHETESIVVVMLLGINMMLPLIFSPFTVGLYSEQRFDLRSLVSCASQIIYVILVLVSFYYYSPNIIYLAAATLISNFLATIEQMRISKKILPLLNISWRFYDKTKVKEIGAYSLWTFVIQVTTLLLLNTDYIIINKVFGSVSVTEYSLAARWNEVLWAVMTAAVGVVNPLVTHLEAKNNFLQLREVLVRGVRFVLILIIPPSILLCVFSKELLHAWVGDGFDNAIPVFWASILPLIPNIATLPATAILAGMGKVKWPAIANLFSAALNILLSLFFVLKFDLGILGVAIATSIALLLKNVLFIPFYTVAIIRAKICIYFLEFVSPIIAMMPMLGLAFYFKYSFDLSNWVLLLTFSGICVCLFGATSYFFVLKQEDRNDIIELFKKSMDKVLG